MSKIVRSVAIPIALFGMIFGLYIIMHGHLTPGGGFQGGAVIASVVVLFVVAFGVGRVKKSIREKHLSLIESGGALLFIGLAFGGIGIAFFYNFLVGSPFFGNIPPSGPNTGDVWSGGVLPLMNFGVGFKVIAGLSAVVLAMAFFAGGDEKEE